MSDDFFRFVLPALQGFAGEAQAWGLQSSNGDVIVASPEGVRIVVPAAAVARVIPAEALAHRDVPSSFRRLEWNWHPSDAPTVQCCAEGAEFPDGSVVMHGVGNCRGTEFYASLENFLGLSFFEEGDHVAFLDGPERANLIEEDLPSLPPVAEVLGTLRWKGAPS